MNQLIQIIIGLLTVSMEAGGEPYLGKLAVAYVCCQNRVKFYGKSISDVALLAEQFSSWDTKSPTRMNIDSITDASAAECLKAVLAAMFQLEPDPTRGAIFYMNTKTVILNSGSLPDYWTIDGDPESEVVIGNHTFRRHR
jgi:spore germination cell wall hydrolase CwlJ-like protein